MFYEQARGLVEGGVDVLLVETSQDILEVRAAVVGINRYFADAGVRIPLQVQVTLDTSGRMLFGTDIASALTTLEALPIDVIGLNCSTGPEHMATPDQVPDRAQHQADQRAAQRRPADQRGWRGGLPDAAGSVREHDGRVCGLGRERRRRLLRHHAGTSRQARSRASRANRPPSAPPLERQPQTEPAASSGMRAVDLRQIPPPTLIGERVNSQGSRKIKRLLLDDDYDGIVAGREAAGRMRARTCSMCAWR